MKTINLFEIIMRVLSILILSSTIFFANTILVSAEVSSERLEFFDSIYTKYRDNLINLDDVEWSFVLNEKLSTDTNSIVDYLCGVYSVMPFYTNAKFTADNNKTKVSLTNKSKYNYNDTINIAKKWNQDIIKEGMTYTQKIRAIHDKILLEVSYKTNIDLESHGPSSAVFKKTAVCDGYSRLFSIMATLEDIPNIMVTLSNMNHAFNLVYVDGSWLMLDTTFDDQGKLSHRFFLVDPLTSSDKHVYDTAAQGLTLDDYIQIANYVYKIN